jgi:hypothetical protein
LLTFPNFVQLYNKTGRSDRPTSLYEYLNDRKDAVGGGQVSDSGSVKTFRRFAYQDTYRIMDFLFYNSNSRPLL